MTAHTDDPPRIRRERRTIRAMIALYCRHHHADGQELCADCRGLLDYAMARLSRCPFGGHKPTCARCPVHCYKPAMRAQVQQVMRYAGPRMLWHHPLLALMHIADKFRCFRSELPEPSRRCVEPNEDGPSALRRP